MNLSLNEQYRTGKLDKTLNIHPHRKAELTSILLTQIKSVEDSPGVTMLCDSYRYLAGKCNNIEEYTFCMHAFIFYMSRIGGLSTESIFTN